MSASSKPLSASLGEALASKSSETVRLLSQSQPAAAPARPSPPSSRPSRIAVYAQAAPPPQLHSLPPPEGPDRSLVAKDDERENRKRRMQVTPDVRAAAVKRVLGDGELTKDVADSIGVSRSTVSLWVKEAKLSAQAETRQKFEANDISRTSQELAEALNLQRAAAERVKVLKAKLRELLGED